MTSHNASPVRIPVASQTNRGRINLSHKPLTNPFLISATISCLCVIGAHRPARAVASDCDWSKVEFGTALLSCLLVPVSFSRWDVLLGVGYLLRGWLFWALKELIVCCVLGDFVLDMINGVFLSLFFCSCFCCSFSFSSFSFYQTWSVSDNVINTFFSFFRFPL